MAQRISIGFHASPPLATRVSDAELDRLRGALGVEAEDGSIRLNLQHVLWLRVEKDEQRVGFGIAS
jgi:DNA mismatch repair protein MutH